MNSIIPKLMGAFFPASLSRANLQAVALVAAGLILAASLPDYTRVCLGGILILTLAALTGPSVRKGFPGCFDTTLALRRQISWEIVSSHDPAEVLKGWLSGPYAVHASSVLLVMREAVASVYGDHLSKVFGIIPPSAVTRPPQPVVSPSAVQVPVPQVSVPVSGAPPVSAVSYIPPDPTEIGDLEGDHPMGV